MLIHFCLSGFIIGMAGGAVGFAWARYWRKNQHETLINNLNVKICKLIGRK